MMRLIIVRLVGFTSSLTLALLIGFVSAVQAIALPFPPSWRAQTLDEEEVPADVQDNDSAEEAAGEAADELDDNGELEQAEGDRPERPPIPDDFMTPQNADSTIILGQPAEAPYVVAVPGSRDELLDRVQAIVPQAFLTDSRRGRYVQAGAFPTRSQAEALSCQLRHQGLDARVVYFRVR